MSFPLPAFPTGSFKRSKSLWDVIQECGLSTNCKLCLDAADSASYDGTSQTWYDMSGNGFDWYRGVTSGSESSDPTFNGTANNLSENEYFSFDGGDYFTMAIAEPSWLNNLHKDNAIYSMVFLYNPGSSAPSNNRWIFSTSDAALATQIGVAMVHTAAGNGTLQVRGATGALVLSQALGALTLDKMNFIGLSLDEPAGEFRRSIETGLSLATGISYASPSASAHTSNVQIGGGGARTGTVMLDAGRRLGAMAIWEGTALTLTQLDNLKTRLGSRRN
jgi:hypothetical protein